MKQKHLIIVGSGWAGMKLARELKKYPQAKLKVTLISDITTFRYSAALYRAATGHKEHEAIIPISEILSDNPHINFLKETITHIDREKKIISTKDGMKFHYDYAVLALGMVTSYFGIPGIDQYSYNIKTTSELHHFRAHLHREMIDENSLDKSYNVIGAGPTGVELAAALTSYIKIIAKKHKIKSTKLRINLIEAQKRVLPISNEKASQKTLKRLRKLNVKVMLNQKVELQTPDFLQVNGVQIPTSTVIWTAGVTNNPFFKKNEAQFSFNPRGKIVVDNHLMVDDAVYVIGDNADTPYSGLGLTAVDNAGYVYKDLKRQLKGSRRRPGYKPLVPATAIPAGKKWAVFQYRKFVLTGPIASLIRSIADLVAYSDILGYKKALHIWLTSEEKEEKCQVCKTSFNQI
jgi:NADH dehydrogenase